MKLHRHTLPGSHEPPLSSELCASGALHLSILLVWSPPSPNLVQSFSHWMSHLRIKSSHPCGSFGQPSPLNHRASVSSVTICLPICIKTFKCICAHPSLGGLLGSREDWMTQAGPQIREVAQAAVSSGMALRRCHLWEPLASRTQQAAYPLCIPFSPRFGRILSPCV